MIYNVKGSGLENHNREPIERGLLNWRRIWVSRLKSLTSDEVSALGFIANSMDFWHLAQIFWNEGVKPPGEQQAQLGADLDSMEEIHKILQRLQL